MSTLNSSSGAVLQRPITSKRRRKTAGNAYAARFANAKIFADEGTPVVLPATGSNGNGLIYALVSPFSQHKAPAHRHRC